MLSNHYEMNEIVNKLLLAGDKLLREMYLKQSGFTYSAYGSFTKNKEKRQKIKKQKQKIGDSRNIYRNELDKACFQHDMTYGYFKDLAKRAASDEVLRDKAFNFAKNRKYDEYQGYLASIVYNFFDKKIQVAVSNLC